MIRHRGHRRAAHHRVPTHRTSTQAEPPARHAHAGDSFAALADLRQRLEDELTRADPGSRYAAVIGQLRDYIDAVSRGRSAVLAALPALEKSPPKHSMTR